jgi:hypothetical protein
MADPNLPAEEKALLLAQRHVELLARNKQQEEMLAQHKQEQVVGVKRRLDDCVNYGDSIIKTTQGDQFARKELKMEPAMVLEGGAALKEVGEIRPDLAAKIAPYLEVVMAAGHAAVQDAQQQYEVVCAAQKQLQQTRQQEAAAVLAKAYAGAGAPAAAAASTTASSLSLSAKASQPPSYSALAGSSAGWFNSKMTIDVSSKEVVSQASSSSSSSSSSSTPAPSPASSQAPDFGNISPAFARTITGGLMSGFTAIVR